MIFLHSLLSNHGYMILFSLEGKFSFDSSLLSKYIEVRKTLAGCGEALHFCDVRQLFECLLQQR